MSPDRERLQAALPGYEVGGQIGRGGCGVVLEGTHRKLQRRVAIKQIPQQFAADSEVRLRFVAEAQLMASLDHPHVAPVYDYVEDDDLCLLVMEHLPGGTVEKRFTTEGFDAAAALAVALACAAGLEAAHRAGILHRDIKPSNLMFSAAGALKITDFGIAKIVGDQDTLLTRAGEVIGTPSYMAPEQARGLMLSPATDVYALATMLYQLLSGELPFPTAGGTMALLLKHAFDPPRALTETAPSVPGPIAEVVMRGLATDPDDRYPSAEDFGVALAGPAASLWGSDWPGPVGIPVIGSDTIIAAATSGVQRAAATVQLPAATVQLSTTTARLPRAPEKVAVFPTTPLVRAGVDLASVDRSDVVPARELLTARPSRVPWMVCAALALCALAVAWLGLGSATGGGNLPPGEVTIAGVDPTSGGEVTIDQSVPIPVTVSTPDADAVGLAMTVAGLRVGGHTVALTSPQRPVDVAVPPPVNPYLVAGTTTGELTLTKNGMPTAHYQFAMRSTQRAVTTALAVGAVLAALFGVAHIESCLRSLRRRRSRIAAALGLPAAAAVLAVAAALIIWVLTGRELSVQTLVVAAALAGAAGVAGVAGVVAALPRRGAVGMPRSQGHRRSSST